MKSLRIRLTVEFCLVALTALAIIWVVAAYSTQDMFGRYVIDHYKGRASSVALVLSEYWRIYGTWSDLESIMVFPRPGMGHGRMMGQTERLVVFDSFWTVVYDSHAGVPVPRYVKDASAPISVDGKIVGYVAVIPPISSESTLGMLEQEFLSRTRGALTLAGFLAILLAIGLAVRLSKTLSKPFEDLKDAACRVAKGDYSRSHVAVDPSLPAEVTELANAFSSMAAAIEREEQSRREFLRDIAHELRTPLTILKGNLEAISLGVVKPEEEVMNAMAEEVSRMESLVESLRELDNAFRHANFHFEAVNPGELIQYAASSVQGLATAKGIRIETSVQKGLPAVWADPSKIQQVFSNLLSNALRYTPAGGTITLGACLSPDAKSVVFKVSDSGPGIKPSDLPRVFDRFYRGDPSRARSTGGSGLGLSIAKEIVERCGGRIWAENTETGAVFSFEIGFPPDEDNLGTASESNRHPAGSKSPGDVH